MATPLRTRSMRRWSRGIALRASFNYRLGGWQFLYCMLRMESLSSPMYAGRRFEALRTRTMKSPGRETYVRSPGVRSMTSPMKRATPSIPSSNRRRSQSLVTLQQKPSWWTR